MTHQEIADNLLTPLWRGLPTEYKVKYALNIWSQFENNLRSAASTSHAAAFLSRITTRLGITIFQDDTEKVASIIGGNQDRELLRTLRTDTTLLVLICRVSNEERRERVREEKDAKERKSAQTSLLN